MKQKTSTPTTHNKQSPKVSLLLGVVFLFAGISVGAQPDLSKLSAKERIAVADREQVEAATDYGFQSMMDHGHALFQEKQYLKAIRAYEDAQRKRPNNVYPKVKITDIELSMKDTLALLREAEKMQMPEPATDRSEYTPPAQTVEETPEDSMKRMNEWEKQERENRERDRERNEKKPEPIGESKGDVPKISLEDYQKELAQKYPSGITEEQYKEGNKSIVKRVVVREGKGNEYKRVEHNWGGVFYFKNGDAVTERVWKGETEK